MSVGALLSVVALAEGSGGYFPTAWGWSVLAFAWISAMTLIVSRRVERDRLALGYFAGVVVLITWTALSITWSSGTEQSVLEVQRGLLYLTGVLAALLVVRRRLVGHLLAGLLGGIVLISGQALASRLFPGAGAAYDQVALGRLSDPVEYFNALGLFAVMGVFLALGFAVRGRRLAVRTAAAAVLPILVMTAYFTYSRGAVLAVVAGLVALVAIDRRRLTFVTVGALVVVPSMAAAWIASRTDTLTGLSASRAAVADSGHDIAIVLLLSMMASATAAAVTWRLQQRIRIPLPAQRAVALALACLTVASATIAVIDQGGPAAIASRIHNSIQEKEPGADPTTGNLNARLGSVGIGGRLKHWRVAWREHQEHPILGSGAGTFEQFWVRDRATPFQARDAHSLYLETLAQLGWPGLAFLLTMLALPLVGAVRARREPLVAGAFGAYVAYLVLTGIDWDWEVPVVTLIALLCGVAMLAAARDERAAPGWTISPALRALGVAAVLAVAVFSVVGLVGNRALAAAATAADAGEFRKAQADARTAISWAPWSAQAHAVLGRAQVGLGRTPQGLASLREATRMNPNDWRIWYELGFATSSRERERAFARAATLNPLERDIQALRAQQGYPPLPAVRQATP